MGQYNLGGTRVPIKECTLPDGRKGFQWGNSGKCYADRADAEKQAAAAHANGYALDSSARTYDADGRMHISKSHISKAMVSPYLGNEIPNWQALGLKADQVYKLLRDPEELKKGASTFARLPILSRHVPISSASFPNELIVGAIGSDVEFNSPYLDADVCIWVNSAIGGIESKKIHEFSCAYRYVAVMTIGEFEGESYDGVMTEIEGNHLALVESGRAGPEVRAMDSAIPEITNMKMTKLGKALFVALGAVSPKIAQDASLGALVGNATKTNFDKAGVRAKLIAMDAEKETTEKVDKVMDALMDVDDPEPQSAEDEEEDEETEAEKKKRLARDKKAADKKAKDAEMEEKGKKAMDEAMGKLRSDLRDAEAAKVAVRPVVGDVIAQDSAEAIYTFALDHMKVKHEGVTQLAGLKALFDIAQSAKAPASTKIAQDSAGLAAKFPGATRFKLG